MTAYTLFKRAYTQYMSKVIWTISDKSDITTRKYLNQAFQGMLGQYTFVCGGSNGFMLWFDIRIDVDSNPADTNTDTDTTNPAVDVDTVIANKTLTNIKCLREIRLYDGFWLCHHDIVTGTWTFSHYIFKWEAMKTVSEWSKYSKKHQDWYLIVKIGYKGLNE